MSLNIIELIKEDRLIVHFQPIVSTGGRGLFGFESLIRGVGRDGSLIAPYLLFEEAAKLGLSLELDKIARILAIRAFAPLYGQNNKLLLFVNFESSLIDEFEPGNYLFYGELKKAGIPYENVVLEIKEDEIRETQKLKLFCEHYRALGFNIALDDFGVGQSSFDRIAIARPDIIKIDRSLISGIDSNQIHKEIVGAISKMCHNIGAITLAEGIENKDEAVKCLKLGATLMQGFYIARPSADMSAKGIEWKMKEINEGYKERLRNLQREELSFHEMGEVIKGHFCDILSKVTNLRDWGTAAANILSKNASIEALYLIDKANRQVGETLIKSKVRAFYEPSSDGCDYSLKEYHVRAKSSASGKYLTEPYLSLASGNLCRTYASKLCVNGEEYVLCVDFLS